MATILRIFGDAPPAGVDVNAQAETTWARTDNDRDFLAKRGNHQTLACAHNQALYNVNGWRAHRELHVLGGGNFVPGDTLLFFGPNQRPLTGQYELRYIVSGGREKMRDGTSTGIMRRAMVVRKQETSMLLLINFSLEPEVSFTRVAEIDPAIDNPAIDEELDLVASMLGARNPAGAHNCMGDILNAWPAGFTCSAEQCAPVVIDAACTHEGVVDKVKVTFQPGTPICRTTLGVLIDAKHLEIGDKLSKVSTWPAHQEGYQTGLREKKKHKPEPKEKKKRVRKKRVLAPAAEPELRVVAAPEPEPEPEPEPDPEPELAGLPITPDPPALAADAGEYNITHFNLDPQGTGVSKYHLPAGEAVGVWLLANWPVDSDHVMLGRVKVVGFDYSATLSPQDREVQAKNTLKIYGKKAMQAAIDHIDGFLNLTLDGLAKIQVCLAPCPFPSTLPHSPIPHSLIWQARFPERRFKIVEAHALRQRPDTMPGAGFGIHTDKREGQWTLVVKVTGDSEYESASRMMVLGGSGPFAFGPLAGDAGFFNGLMYHRSMAPQSMNEHLKMVLFFKEM